ncbi:hypothetical protein B0H10DRAFT_1944130 [Mycena sp. CBHHK59/15]|nr:hypothetical protein B0H10DRAFT_1944130 [Mycena sp. CBHHK59/15]
MANLQSTVGKEKEWKGLKLTPITEEEDSSNNYGEFKQKSILDLDTARYWPFVAGPDYNPPIIPELMLSMQVQGLDATGNLVPCTILGNEAVIDAAKKNAEAWLLMDKKAHTLIVKAVLSVKLYVVCDCKSAHEAWNALKNKYELANTLTTVTIKQQIIAYQCSASEDPVNWCQVMVQLYGKLRDADLFMTPDPEFAKHLVTLMSPSDTWRYCRDSLHEKVRQSEVMRSPVSSVFMINHMKQEKLEMRIAPSIVYINALIAGGRGKHCDTGDAVPGVYTAGPSNQANRKSDKTQQYQAKHLGLYKTQQRSGP